MKENDNNSATQMQLDIGVQVQKNVNGVEMGVLENGVAYLTQRGLARLCGQSHKKIYEITKEWEEYYDEEILTKDRISFIKEQLFKSGFQESKLYLECKQDGRDVYAYPEPVCMAALEWYAFEASGDNTEAQKNYRKLARFGLQQFIYQALNYRPDDKWKYHLDRVSILKNKTPVGYFTVFQEIAGMVVDLISSGLPVNEHTIPDISVGIKWSEYWKGEELEKKYGLRIDYPHEYQDYYPQSRSNPQPAKAYPEEALAEFRKWFRGTYLPTKFPKYILRKAKVLPGGKEDAERMIEIFEEKRLEQEEASLSTFNKSLKTALDYDPKKS